MGSLFKLRDLWATKCGEEEEFDKKCIAISNIDNDPSNADKIVLGSLSGTLRIFQPRQKGFKPDDILLEVQLDAPIIHVAEGRFLPNSSLAALAVLHPRKLTVYTITRQGSVTSDGASDPLARQFAAKKEYEHHMERTAYNLCYGPFGGVSQKDYICVQSMDGQLQFFEQDRLVFSRFLHNFLVPGHLCYNPKSDSFITNTSSMDIECYKYQVLHSASGSEEKQDTNSEISTSSIGGKKIQADWTVNVGEDIVDIRVASTGRGPAAGQQDVVVLGERTLFLLKEQGGIKQQKRLDYFSSCLCPYTLNSERKFQNLIVGTCNNSIHVFDDKALVWAAKTVSAPIAIEVASFCKVDGMIVMLSADGQLSVNYLGTDPATNPVQNLESKELDYEEMDEEHRRLQTLIRQAVNAGKAEPKDQVQLNVEVPLAVDSRRTATFDGPISQHSHCVTAKVALTYGGEEDIENAVLTVLLPPPFTLDEKSILIPCLSGSTGRPTASPITIDLPIYLPEAPAGKDSGVYLPTSLMASCLLAYTSPSGDPLTTKASFVLPLALAGCVISPVKNPQYKITLDTNRLPPPLGQLFDDLLAGKADVGGAGNVLSFQYHHASHADATILVSKNAGRYRIQSGVFEALWLLSSELARRLHFHFTEGAGVAEENPEPFSLTYTENLPFQEYFVSIEAHFKARQALAQSQQVLGERAHQFRSIQKRLLVRFKDRNPSPLCNVDLLFEDTYRQLIKMADSVDEHQRQLQAASNNLTCATNLMLFLIKYRFQLKKEDFAVLQHYLSPVVVDSPTQGWEECVDAAMTHLLRTSLAKNARESGSLPQPLQVPSDINKLKKHIALVCDRLAKGGSLKIETTKKPAK